MIFVQSETFNPGEALNSFMAGRTEEGAVVSFTGHVRNSGDNDNVTALELEHYPVYTETEIAKIETKAHARWIGIDCLIIHRFGKMFPGEPIVFVAVCSAHRSQAFEAASFLMDYLKTNAPFWKKEIRGDKEVWVEPKDSDYASRENWAQKDWDT